MAHVALILPDIALILAGFGLARLTRWGGEFWAGVEKLTYFVLFPALLFYSNARATIDLAAAGSLLVTVLGTIGAGIVFGFAGKLFRAPAPTFAAGFQCAFRFNSYIGLALAARLGGDSGIALMAAIVGVTVPLVNTVSVIALARGRGGRVMREIATNPLIVSCVAGILYGALRLPLPEVAQTVLSRFGAAALVLGLLAVGAAFNPALPRGNRGLIAYLLAVKLLALPAVAWALGRALSLSPETMILAVAFAALPTAPAAYILAVRLGGDSRLASTLVSYSVAGSLVTLPLWVAAVR